MTNWGTYLTDLTEKEYHSLFEKQAKNINRHFKKEEEMANKHKKKQST